MAIATSLDLETGEGLEPVMGIEDGGATEIIVEDAEEAAGWEICPCCGIERWVRVIAAYARGSCYVIFCGGCGKPIEEKWNILP